jgi:hypothetical protein
MNMIVETATPIADLRRALKDFECAERDAKTKIGAGRGRITRSHS